MASFFVHPTSIIEEGAGIGTGTKIWHFCHIMPGATIGENCTIGQNVFIASGVIIGNNVKIQNNVSVYTGVILEDNVFVGPSAVFTNVINPRSHIVRKHEYKTTFVRHGATIGANATIICGVTLGRFCFIGAGAVVTNDVPEYSLYFGNPAKCRGWVCECGTRLAFSQTAGGEVAVCAECGKQYRKEDETIFLVRGRA